MAYTVCQFCRTGWFPGRRATRASYLFLGYMHVQCTQSINESACFRFLQRLSFIFGFRRDCPRSLASCRDCCAWEIVSRRDFRVIKLPPAESLGRKQNHTDSLYRKPFFVDGSLGRKQEITDSLGGSHI